MLVKVHIREFWPITISEVTCIRRMSKNEWCHLVCAHERAQIQVFWSENQPGFAYMIRPRSSGSLGRKQPPSTLKPSLATRTAHVECISSAVDSSVCRKRGLYNSIFCTYVFTKYAHLYINISTYQSFNISIYQHINISIYRYINISIVKISIYQYIDINM